MKNLWSKLQGRWTVSQWMQRRGLIINMLSDLRCISGTHYRRHYPWVCGSEPASKHNYSTDRHFQEALMAISVLTWTVAWQKTVFA